MRLFDFTTFYCYTEIIMPKFEQSAAANLPEEDLEELKPEDYQLEESAGDRLSGIRRRPRPSKSVQKAQEAFNELRASDFQKERMGGKDPLAKFKQDRVNRMADEAEELSDADISMHVEDADLKTEGQEAFEDLIRSDKEMDALPELAESDYAMDVSDEDLVELPSSGGARAKRARRRSRKAYDDNRKKELGEVLAIKQQEAQDREARIEEHKLATRMAREEKRRIEQESEESKRKARLQSMIDEENRPAMEAARIEALRKSPAADQARAEGRAQFEAIQREAAPIRERNEATMMADLDIDERGEVIGLKNLPEVNGLAVYKGMASAMRRINADFEWARVHLTGKMLTQYTHDLEHEADVWRSMYDQVEHHREMGESLDEVIIENPFYQTLEVSAPKGMDRTEFETVLISPEEELNQKEQALVAEQQALVDQAGSIADQLNDLGNLSKHRNDVTAHETFATTFERARQMAQDQIALLEKRFDFIDAQVQEVQRLKDPDLLDIDGARLRHEMEAAKAHIETLREELKTFRGKKDIKQGLQDQIDVAENAAAMASAKLNGWRVNNKKRPESIRRRLADLDKQESDLIQDKRIISMQIADMKDRSADIEQTIATLQGKAESAVEAYFAQPLKEQKQMLEDAWQYTARELMRVGDELMYLREAREQKEDLDIDVDVDLSGLEEDVDLSDLEDMAPTQKRVA